MIIKSDEPNVFPSKYSQMSESGHMNNPNVYESNSNSHVFSSMPKSINTISEMISARWIYKGNKLEKKRDTIIYYS